MSKPDPKSLPPIADQLRPLLQTQAAAAITCASLFAQWAGIAAGFVSRGANHVATLAEEEKRVFPDSYERVAGALMDDYVRSLRETAALPQTGALRFAREMQKQRDGE